MVISPATHANSAPVSPPALASLSDRERQVLALVPTQPNNDAIARLLGLSPFTVKTPSTGSGTNSARPAAPTSWPLHTRADWSSPDSLPMPTGQ
ncbi:LuxR C-terminal-related transcriptional regulator [Streptomyces sp. NPDC057575]|uniref:LuxR C-terminal-related transcriptional regulator n=1 Tax=unclassified Streptomyces TaxID=2593676 RepID=UPI003685BD95